jgi:hypothetical protein
MSFTTQTQMNKSPFQNLDTISALKEISDGHAAICNGGKYELTNIKCLDEQDGLFSNDEIYIKVNGNTVWSKNDVSKGQIFSLESLGALKGNDKVELWENDPGSGNDDLIGSFKPNTVNGRVELNQTGKYSVGVKNV